MASAAMNKSVPRCLVAPSNIARSLDWRKKGAFLTMHVGKSTIDLATTSHPDYDKNPIQPLPSIPLQIETKGNKKVLKAEVVAEISNVVREFKTQGMVVSWPVQREGWCGASCGKVLHMLEQILQEGAGMNEQKVCLWNGNHFHSMEDEWGRAAIYSVVPTNKTEHLASKEQYEEDGLVATAIARDFLEHHWPSLFQKQEDKSSKPIPPTSTIASQTSSANLSKVLTRTNATTSAIKAKSLICNRM